VGAANAFFRDAKGASRLFLFYGARGGHRTVVEGEAPPPLPPSLAKPARVVGGETNPSLGLRDKGKRRGGVGFLRTSREKKTQGEVARKVQFRGIGFFFFSPLSCRSPPPFPAHGIVAKIRAKFSFATPREGPPG